MLRGAISAVLILSALAHAARLTIVNGTMGWVLKGVFIRPADRGSDWGENLLGDHGFVGISGSWSSEVEPGVYDIRVEDTDGDGYQRLGVSISGPYRWKVALQDMNDPLSRIDPAYTWGG